MTEDGIGWDPGRGELWFAGETAEAVLLELEARRRELHAEVEALAAAAAEAERQAEEASAAAATAAEAFRPVAHLRNVRHGDPAHLERLTAGAERLDETLRVAAAAAARLEAPLAERTSSFAEDLRSTHHARASCEARSARSTRAPWPPSASRTAASPRLRARPAPSGPRPRRSRRRRGRPPSRPRRPPSGRGRPPACSPRPIRRRRRRPNEGVLAQLLAGAERLEERSRWRSSATRRRCASAPRRRPRARRSSAPSCGAWAPTRSSCAAASSEAGERVGALDVELARVEAERDEAGRRLEAAAAEPAEGEGRDELAERLVRCERRREALGQVNPLAKEEYEAEKERLQELSAQREDLERSLNELEKLRDDLTKTVETRFAETFAAVEQHFHEVAATLFPGGEGRLLLSEPEEEGEEAGVEVELRPAGKRVTRLSLLSGGEKALGAIAFLFSLFLARPSPFYLLDEVEAALDDTNIERFTELLRRYADRAQFIVITHQKRTMEAADVLYGVTMGSDGVSQIVSRRLPREDEAAATA